ncbi:MAG: histidine phosphatase family protein [Balneolales bacterium]|nr:histidine phosphatase family protein [Balneolales bacterium]
MELVVIRHTPVLGAKGLCYGQADLSVDESLFETQSRQILELLKDDLNRKKSSRITAFYSSPLMRCSKLAEFIQNELPHVGKPIIEPALMEIKFGEWEAKSWDDIPEKELSHWMKNYLTESPPGGESMDELIERVRKWLNGLKLEIVSKSGDGRDSDNPRILIITHAGVIRSLRLICENLPKTQFFDYAVNETMLHLFDN